MAPSEFSNITLPATRYLFFSPEDIGVGTRLFHMLGQGFDGRTCRYLRVSYEDVKAQVLSGKADAEVLEWCFTHGRRLTDEEVLIYNSFMSKRGWHDDESDGFIPEMIRQYGLKDDGSVRTDFDLIEMDEGRWYPHMWRDAWK